MEIIRGIQSLNKMLPHPVVTIGNFDGVHLGHQKIIQETLGQARKRRGTAVAYTFRPHPRAVLRPESNIQLLTTYDERLEIFKALGLGVVVEEPFSRNFSTVAPEQFFTDMLLRRLNVEAIVVGYDFAFGKERAGHLEALEDWSRKAGVELTVVQPLREGSEIVSSTRIRQHLLNGEVEIASRLLGRHFFYRGVVIKGDARGRKIGFPTANIKLEPGKVALPYGVYATWATIKSGQQSQIFPSVTNIGIRPTFRTSPPGVPVEDQEPQALIETHLLDQSIDLYGSTLEVSFVSRLRDEEKFNGIEELKKQINQDAQAARKILVDGSR